MDKKMTSVVITLALGIPALYAQESASQRPEASTQANEPLTARNPQVSQMEIAGKRSKGLDAPESAAITMLYDHANLRSWLSESDILLLDSARVNSERRVKRNLAFEDVCRQALFLSGQGISPNEAANFGRQLDKAEDITNKIIVDTYHAMLETLSEDGAKLVEETKVGIHKHMGAIEYNWEQQTQVDPNIINNYARNCTASQ